ncbi:MAG: hypothetical protein R2713_01720 [Ilumatobacteraceae bacterium]
MSFAGANDPAAIGADDAGAIFFHGSDDDIVPTSSARATRDAMVAAGLPVSWNEFPGEGHDLSDASALSRIAHGPVVRRPGRECADTAHRRRRSCLVCPFAVRPRSSARADDRVWCRSCRSTTPHPATRRCCRAARRAAGRPT